MRQTFVVVALYEDQRGSTNEFGLHELVVACVADRLGCEAWQIGDLISGRPMKGAEKLLVTCRDKGAQLCDRSPVFVLADEDRIRRTLKLAHDASLRAVIQELETKWFRSPRLGYHLLSQNLESVIRAFAECHPSVDDEKLRRALAKQPLERDQLLKHAARSGNAIVRTCIQAKVPTLGAFVAAIEDVIRPHLAR